MSNLEALEKVVPEVVYSDTTQVEEDKFPWEDDIDEEAEIEWETKWKNLKKLCLEKSTTIPGAFGTHIHDINSQLGSDLEKLISTMSMDDLLKLTEKVQGPIKEKPKTANIKIEKGLNQNQIKEYVVRIDAQLKELKVEDVIVTTSEWEKSSEPFPMINAAKKLFAKYVEAGLLGLLYHHGFKEAAKKLYCIAHAKAKITDENIIFTNVDSKDYQERLAKSYQVYAALIGIETQ